MNIVAKIAVLGTFSKDKYDRIAAIVDGEYRGFADLEYDPDLNEYRAYLTAYSNSANGETVEFHIWDRTNLIEWWATDKKLAFTSDGSYGEPNIPININATGEVAQQFKFSQGWDWMSFNLESSVMSLESIFEDLRPSFGDRLVNQNGFAQYAEKISSARDVRKACHKKVYVLFPRPPFHPHPAADYYLPSSLFPKFSGRRSCFGPSP
mgnify:CR=1 FL=1